MAILVTIFCGLLFVFMRVVGAYFGRSIGTLAGVALIAVPCLILAATALLFLTGGVAVVVSVPVAAFLLYRKVRG